MPLTLPSGRTGRMIALTGTLLLLGIIWVGVLQPLRDWYADGDAWLTRRRTLADRMADLAAQVPELTRRSATLAAAGSPSAEILTDDTDAVAGATLQEIIQGLAGARGVIPTSIENLPAIPTGQYHRVGLRLSVVARFPVLVQLLQAIAEGSPRMLIDELHVEGAHLIGQPVDAPLEAQFTVLAFRTAKPSGPAPAAGSKF